MKKRQKIDDLENRHSQSLFEIASIVEKSVTFSTFCEGCRSVTQFGPDVTQSCGGAYYLEVMRAHASCLNGHLRRA